MLVFRPIKLSDLNDLCELAQNRSVGVTTLPNDRKALREKIKTSIESFKRDVKKPFGEFYFFALEDIELKKVIGVSGIIANIGLDAPFYTYHISQLSRQSIELDIFNTYKVLHLGNEYQGVSELRTLFLSRDFRKHGNGRLLSLARFLFIAQFQNRFAEKIIAEMRGVSDKHGDSPFWNGLGKNFFKMDFAKADRLSAVTNKQFISDLMPRHAIYINLLNPKAQTVIGKPHKETIGAYKMLEQQGFQFHNHIDIFDAGPIIEAETKNISAINNSITFKIQISDHLSASKALLANTAIDFRAVFAEYKILNSRLICISKKVARTLKVKQGDSIRLLQI